MPSRLTRRVSSNEPDITQRSRNSGRGPQTSTGVGSKRRWRPSQKRWTTSPTSRGANSSLNEQPWGQVVGRRSAVSYTSEVMPRSILANVTPGLLMWAREESGLSIDAVARRVGVAPSRMEGWEQGERKPTVRQTMKLANVYRRAVRAVLPGSATGRGAPGGRVPAPARRQARRRIGRVQAGHPHHGPASRTGAGIRGRRVSAVRPRGANLGRC